MESPILLKGTCEAKAEFATRIFSKLKALPAMNKRVMGGACKPQTDRMVSFMTDSFGFHAVPGTFVPGVRKFELSESPDKAEPDTQYTFCDRAKHSHKPAPHAKSKFVMTAEEIRKWQSTFRVFFAEDMYEGEAGKDMLMKSLRGQSAAGAEAYRMKFAARISMNPVLCTFDAEVIPRAVNDRVLERIVLVSMSGVDFAGREHDVDDIRTFIANWRDVYVPWVWRHRLPTVVPSLLVWCFSSFHVDRHGEKPIVFNGRDFAPIRNHPRPIVKAKELVETLMKMARIRLRALDALGVKVRVWMNVG